MISLSFHTVDAKTVVFFFDIILVFGGGRELLVFLKLV